MRSKIKKNLNYYPQYKKYIQRKQLQFNTLYLHAKNKKKILDSVRTFLEKNLIDSMLAYWKNTEWDFNGITETPGKGQIACGYFVSTTIRDLGFIIPRYKYAQMASSTHCKAFCQYKQYSFSNQSVKNIIDKIDTLHWNVYIVGLDNHIGYLVRKNKLWYFLHSSYYDDPTKFVRMDPVSGHNPFANSSYRILGVCFDENMLINWLMRKPYN